MSDTRPRFPGGARAREDVEAIVAERCRPLVEVAQWCVIFGNAAIARRAEAALAAYRAQSEATGEEGA